MCSAFLPLSAALFRVVVAVVYMPLKNSLFLHLRGAFSCSANYKMVLSLCSGVLPRLFSDFSKSVKKAFRFLKAGAAAALLFSRCLSFLSKNVVKSP